MDRLGEMLDAEEEMVKMPLYDELAEEEQLRPDLWPAEDPLSGEAGTIKRLLEHFHCTAEEAEEEADEIRQSRR